LLAHRHDLRLYHVDARAHRHAARATGPVMRGANATIGTDRWSEAPAELADRFTAYAREQFDLVLEDLQAFPKSPPIVAEGPQLLPELAGSSAVFLIPTPEFQRRAFADRDRSPGVVERDALLAESIRVEAIQLGRRLIEIDGSLSAGQVVEELEALFAALLATPRPLPDLRVLRREENQAVFENLVAAGGSSYPFACECGRSGCTARVDLTLAEFARGDRILAPEHER
jgi:hypothetical protein